MVAGSWSSDQLTDGFVPTEMLAVLGARPADAAALVDAGLWVAVPGGWRFHDWHCLNPLRVEVETKREAERQRKAEARERAAAARRERTA